MRTLFVFIIAAVAAAAQNPAAKISNVSRPGSADFQIGDRFEVVVTAAPNQAISVRTTRQGRTDWSAVIGSTDASGRWSASGQFEKQDFGGWSEAWTVGGKLANPVVEFSVNAPCMPGGRGQIFQSGPNMVLSCDTTAGNQSFGTPSDSDPFRTPDGRVIPGRVRSTETAGEYHAEILQWMFLSNANVQPGKVLAESLYLTGGIIGVNALTEKETQNVIAMIHAAYEGPYRAQRAQPEVFLLLQHLGSATDEASLKQQISGTIAFLQTQ